MLTHVCHTGDTQLQEGTGLLHLNTHYLLRFLVPSLKDGDRPRPEKQKDCPMSFMLMSQGEAGGAGLERNHMAHLELGAVLPPAACINFRVVCHKDVEGFGQRLGVFDLPTRTV